MKLRIKGQNVRFRLSPQDTESLGGGTAVLETLHVGATVLTYGLIPTPEDRWFMDEAQVGVVVHCPQTLLGEWASTDRVGIETQLEVSGQSRVNVLVEKDFQCLVPRGEDDGTTFPHPKANP